MPIEPYRLTHKDLAYQGDFQREHQARVDRPLASLDLTDFFQNVQANLIIGDKIELRKGSRPASGIVNRARIRQV